MAVVEPPDAREADTDLGVVAECQKAAVGCLFAAAPTPGWWFRRLLLLGQQLSCPSLAPQEGTGSTPIRVPRREIRCADCGCLVNAGLVLAPCPDQECC